MPLILKRIFVIILTLVYMICIWLQSSYFNPSELEYHYTRVPQVLLLSIGITLEIAHLLEFGILYMLIIIVFLSFGKLKFKKELLALLISLTYSIVDEVHQYFVPFRSFSIVDMIKNIIGIWFTWYLVRNSYYGSKKNRIHLFLKSFENLPK